MAISLTFLPQKTADILNYANQVKGVISAEGFVPANLGLDAGDVTAFTAALTAAQAAFDATTAAKSAHMATTTALSGPGAALDALLQALRDLANKARASAATDEALAGIGVSRKAATTTPTAVPTDAPEFTLDSVKSGIVNVRFRENGSAAPRARMASAIGVQIAVVNGSAAPADNEADTAPNVFASRNPASLASANWPSHVRLYARWITQRGQTGPWSLPLSIAVI